MKKASGQRTVRKALQKGVEDGVFPGAVLLVSIGGKAVFHEAAGYASLKPRKVKMTRRTFFDLASLTKPVATTSSAMKLVEESAIRLSDRVDRWIPDFKGRGKSAVTIRHLLNHSSGLRAWEPIYKRLIPACRKNRRFISKGKAREAILDRVIQNRLVYTPGTKSIYSDLGFILLGEIIERATGRRLDSFCAKEIFKPLKMNHTFFISGFVSGKKAPKGSFAATERSSWRKKIIRAEVHDDHAFCMGGYAGHAGLFGNARDLDRFAQAMLKGWMGRRTLFSKNTVRRFTRRQKTPKSSWALGWDTPSAGS
ncbi:MAG TPA: serine hydrolase, partial [Nitrospiria bacterium]|nr:serine hydrolase [Nitrospiria bacterium]